MENQVSLVKTTDEYPLPAAATPTDILAALRVVLYHPHISEVQITPGSPLRVTWYHYPGQSLVAPREVSVTDVIHRITLEEITRKKAEPPTNCIHKALLTVGAKQLQPCFFVVGPHTVLRKWLSIPRHFPMYNRLFGLKLLIDETLPPDVLVLLGGADVETPLYGITYGIKMSMESPHVD